MGKFTKPRGKPVLIIGAALSLALLGVTNANAGGGTAKPPAPAPAPPPTNVPNTPPPNFTAGTVGLHQFDMTGFMQTASGPDGSLCPGVPSKDWGGTLKINGISITVPCNSIVQMPASAVTFTELTKAPGLTLAAGGTPSYEAHVVGNIVNGSYIAGLVYVSQQASNTGDGVITSINYSTGTLMVGSAVGSPGADQVAVRLNDPNGRFGLKNSEKEAAGAPSQDPRFQVDDQNPTIHAATGYPMCVPRTDPTSTDDSLCPQNNRPKVVVNATDGRGNCRGFAEAGIVPLPKSGELPGPALGQAYCSAFVTGDPAALTNATAQRPFKADGTAPDARQQAPFEVGDYIHYSGTLSSDNAGGQYVSAHTVEANVGIFTQPTKGPSYLAIGEFGVGSADPNAVAVNGAAQETQNRIFLEAETTDVLSPVDIYMVDRLNAPGGTKYPGLTTGQDYQRWITPYAMTGEGATDPIGGGITTQSAGAQPQRIRLRATKAPIGMLTSPSRYMRVVNRNLCLPSTINTKAADGTECVNKAVAANGLSTGQYEAPVFSYIFPENVAPGASIVPNDFWNFDFLNQGEGGAATGNVGPLTTSPW